MLLLIPVKSSEGATAILPIFTSCVNFYSAVGVEGGEGAMEI